MKKTGLGMRWEGIGGLRIAVNWGSGEEDCFEDWVGGLDW